MLKIGDKVRVRRWKDMKNEYGLRKSSPSTIDCKFTFVSEMRGYCGRYFVIDWIRDDGCIRLINANGAFSTDMLEDPETGAAVSIT